MSNKLTDKEIAKALEQCEMQQTCSYCPYFEKLGCKKRLYKDALDLINRLQARVEKCEKVEHFADKTIATLQAENKNLQERNVILKGLVDTQKAENERLKGIKTTDWLVKGISKEQLQEEKIQALTEEINRLQAENERLEVECDKQYKIAEATIRAEIADGGTSCHWCEDTIRGVAKAEAYKEFAEDLWNNIKWQRNQDLDMEWEINNLLKEKIGEDKSSFDKN